MDGSCLIGQEFADEGRNDMFDRAISDSILRSYLDWQHMDQQRTTAFVSAKDRCSLRNQCVNQQNRLSRVAFETSSQQHYARRSVLRIKSSNIENHCGQNAEIVGYDLIGMSK